MAKGLLEAFTDGVMAVIITIMVLELKVPEGGDLGALRPDQLHHRPRRDALAAAGTADRRRGHHHQRTHPLHGRLIHQPPLGAQPPSTPPTAHATFARLPGP